RGWWSSSTSPTTWPDGATTSRRIGAMSARSRPGWSAGERSWLVVRPSEHAGGSGVMVATFNRKRAGGRRNDELRPVEILPGYAPYAEGSALITMGNTHVLCTATVEDRVPPFLVGTGKGWVTAEYGMLPRSSP